MTPYCYHDKKEECEHCIDGCTMCGELDLYLDDNGLCEDCEFDRQQLAADLLYDSWKDKD